MLRIVWATAILFIPPTIAVAIPSPGVAQEAVHSAARESRPVRDTPAASYELRGQFFSPSYRWSRIEPGGAGLSADRSLYFSGGLGLRIVSAEGHALLLDGDYRFDSDFDGIFNESDFPIRFGVAHAGYAYRYIAGKKRHSRRVRVWTITPHASIAAGAARKLKNETYSTIPQRSPVFGARVGVDLDIHVKRFFVGWSFAYEVLRHTKGGLERSNFLSWNAFPLFRMGVNFGRRVERTHGQYLYPPES